jgi:hypothetical protein
MKSLLLISFILMSGALLSGGFARQLAPGECVAYVDDDGRPRTACLKDDMPDRCRVEIFYGLFRLDMMYWGGVQVLPGTTFPEAWDLPAISCDGLNPMRATVSSERREPVRWQWLPIVRRGE